ncbi:Netrin-G1 [Chelonia mydas]|uniref:Netrin-G1 n=1 Tax=Chelonia mydas TaxID=8469 RepID=M7BQ98_CHEMY|nr:Netrin-G1 [Chelonia mydas]
MCNNECDASTNELAHPPELMFDLEGRHPSTFWQSTTWKDYPKPLQVNITLSWNKTIELTDNIVITFESGRPDQMILEKSLDYGRTWQPYQYYATDCLDAFHMDPKSVKDLSQHTVLEIICTEEYSTGYMTNSKIIHFEIKDRFAFFAGPRLHNMASLYGQLDTTKKLRDFFTITDLRIRLLRPATGEIYVDEQHLARYFYAISDIRVYGSAGCRDVAVRWPCLQMVNVNKLSNGPPADYPDRPQVAHDCSRSILEGWQPYCSITAILHQGKTALNITGALRETTDRGCPEDSVNQQYSQLPCLLPDRWPYWATRDPKRYSTMYPIQVDCPPIIAEPKKSIDLKV